MLGTYIRNIRKSKNISLSQLALRTNLSKSYLSYIERNIQTNPSIGVFMRIAEALDTDIKKLIEASNTYNDDHLPQISNNSKDKLQNSGSSE